MFITIKFGQCLSCLSVALLQVLKDGYRIGAAVLGVPVKATIKEVIIGSIQLPILQVIEIMTYLHPLTLSAPLLSSIK